MALFQQSEPTIDDQLNQLRALLVRRVENDEPTEDIEKAIETLINTRPAPTEIEHTHRYEIPVITFLEKLVGTTVIITIMGIIVAIPIDILISSTGLHFCRGGNASQYCKLRKSLIELVVKKEVEKPIRWD